ncbi:RecQ family ATP-dependent DNA helicase [Stigmatella sp. ncwal1]|uniref:ATP-dependent DNA helicase RecQ n=1 Tax=Stigmatella ashevillensis TaxID=2995309 RepID=A0ABT5DNL0_9BACT|nr:RecQ family ATP-dependent DNA helicase [Stigmatella ashevillena]MDC0714333.1 RecQ family ATP-dependent DNA helicase [Stigmatella ashevillena]
MRRMLPEDLPHFVEAQEGLVRHFGLSEFRPGQAEVISSVLSKRNTVVVMPTGAGKSLCYQLPALLLPGLTLVVSPLIALMKDQVEQLTAKSIPATFINSSLSDLERAERMRRLRAREYRLLYVAPERLRSTSFLETLGEVGIDLLAVDEAHCISQWGHDFRPDYAQLGQIRKRLRPPRTMALTATATPEVRDDIIRVLLMKDPQVFAQGFDRPNLFLEVMNVSGDEEKRQGCAQLAAQGGSGIIYCATRKASEGMHAALIGRGVNAFLYHAGMEDEARRQAQEDFMSAKEAVAVATNAFGMGIDKPDIRFVAHANIPRAVEAYYQEVGRAGRDGQPATAVLLFNHADVYTQERLIEGNHPSDVVLGDIWNVLRQVPEFDKGVGVLAGMVGASEFEVSAALRIFEREGKVERGSRGEGEYGLTLTDKAATAHPHAPDAQQLLQSLLATFPPGRSVTTELSVLSRRTGLALEAVRHALGLLEKAGVVTVRRPFSGRTIRALEQVSFQELGVDLSRMREQERRSLLLLKRMTDYAYTKRCRRAFILGYFGQADLEASCGHCDVCTSARMPRLAPLARPSAATGRPENYSELAATELRRWRKALAKDLEIPSFIIFNDSTLLGLAAALPTDRSTFLSVKGTGESRWERFGAKVVEICLMARAAGHEPVAMAEAPRGRRRRE